MRRMTIGQCLVLGIVALGTGCDEGEPSPDDSTDIELHDREAVGESDVIPGRFIVQLREGSDPRATAAMVGAAPDFVYENVISGFAGALGPKQLAALGGHPSVLRIEPDRRVTVSMTEQLNPPWGLNRIDQRNLPLDDKYMYESAGENATIYVLDTGIRKDHVDFGGRASAGYDVFIDDPEHEDYAWDCHGHGTHVAATAAGDIYGVAKHANIVSVRVLDCNGSGTWSGIIEALDWVRYNAVRPAVVNMSLGGSFSVSVNAAVDNLSNAGVLVVAAAGNEGRNACNSSPAGADEAFAVAASDSNDRLASFSNFGSCVGIIAPGVGIVSAWHTSTTAWKTLSGTSMASPHVAGVAALLLEESPTMTPPDLKKAIQDCAKTNGITVRRKQTTKSLLQSLCPE